VTQIGLSLLWGCGHSELDAVLNLLSRNERESERELTRGFAALTSVVLWTPVPKELVLEGERLDLRAPFGEATQIVVVTGLEPFASLSMVNHCRWDPSAQAPTTHSIAHQPLALP